MDEPTYIKLLDTGGLEYMVKVKPCVFGTRKIITSLTNHNN